MSKIAVIIPAAGKGERFGGKEKKVFAKLSGRPIFIHTLEKFINRDDVCQTILVVSPEDMEQMKSKYGANLGFMGVQVVEGGSERVESVSNALERVKDDAEFIAIHDAARPCVTENMISAVFAEAARSGAAILAAPVSSTLKQVSESKVIDQTMPRSGVYEAQTPQVFRRDLILEAYSKCSEVEGPVTDDSQLVEALGHPVHIVESDATNLKITQKGDITLAGAINKSRPAPKVKPYGAFEEAEW